MGSIFKRGQRYWWHGKLPQTDKYITIPLKAVGQAYATTDKKVAQAIADMMIKKAMFQDKESDKAIGRVDGLVADYIKHAKTYYSQSKEPDNIYYATLPLAKLAIMADDFNAGKLIEYRNGLIKSGLCRNVINQRANIVKRMFKWAVANGRCSPYTLTSLLAVEPLKKGRSIAKETDAIAPTEIEYIRIAAGYAGKVVGSMLMLQLWTGMRSGELVMIKTQDIDTSGNIWVYRPVKHKTGYLGHSKQILIGKQGQMVLEPFMTRLDYCFNPAESIKEFGLIPRGGLRPHYTTNTYYNAVKEAIKKAKSEGKQIEYFNPHQIRHTTATILRKQFSLDTVRAVLGHKSLKITDQYAEIDYKLAEQAIELCG